MNRVVIGVKGERECCTAPSVSKQNTFAYPVVTPSAAHGILSSVFRKPEFDWVVTRIAVVKMGRSDVITCNEVRFQGNKPVVASDPRIRIQSTKRILRDVEYIIEAEPYILTPGTPEKPNTTGKYLNEFSKRMCGKKQFYRTPCLGPREYVCRVYPVSEFPERGGVDVPDMRLPAMLVGMSHDTQRHDNRRGSYPYFADLNIVNGIIEVPRFIASKFKVGENQ